jgi:hypothetical protein
MDHSGVVRALSSGLARLMGGLVREGSGGSGGQDKSREVRRGRGAEQCRDIRHFARGATAFHSLSIRTTRCNFGTIHTSRWRHDPRR